MLKNYIKIALRNIIRNKLYAVINVLGLAMGLAIYVFGGLLYDYEYSHDDFFENSDRIYTLRANVDPSSNMMLKQIDNVQSGIAPLIKTELTEVEQVARTIRREFLITVEDNHYYEVIRFADAELLSILNFDFIYGDTSALNGANEIIITHEIAQKYFGDNNPIGKSITLDHEHDLIIGAVIKNVPQNSHFNSSITDDPPLNILIPMRAMERITGFNPDVNFSNTSSGNLTYVLLPKHLGQDWLQIQLQGLYDRHLPVDQKEWLVGYEARPLTDANTAMWDAVGIPIIQIVEILGLMVLFIACVNYTNLATAQSMGRTREVGLRKTLGASPIELILQFITESITITIIAMVFALAFLEIVIPIFNSATGKILQINYIETLPWLVSTTCLVGFLSGAYPAYLITRMNPIDALKDSTRKGKLSTLIRATMIGAQFTISVAILSTVLVVYAQNQKIEQNSLIFPKDQIYTLERLNVDQMEDRHETLRNEIMNIPYVENITLTSQVPYEQNNSTFQVSTIANNFEDTVVVNQLFIDEKFFETYDIPLIFGRNVSLNNAQDTYDRERRSINVVINETTARMLNFKTPKEAMNKIFYSEGGERDDMIYTIVGVTADRNIHGFFNTVKPFIFLARNDENRLASIKISKNAPISIVNDISDTWKKVFPDYPIQGQFLSETFQSTYKLFENSTKALIAFALFALFLAAIGLFGLAAFMSEQKTKEIGIRKVLGASRKQIIQLLIWQFSLPVLWATPVALWLGYFISEQYLQLFAERIDLPYMSFLFAGIAGLLLSWLTVATHAYNISNTNPVNALHHD